MNPWDRQKGEPHKAFAAFMVYRDLGPARGIQSVATSLSKSRQLMTRWSGRWNWHFRADQFDAHLTRLAEVELTRRMGDRNERNLRVADALMGVSMKVLTKLADHLEEPAFRVSPSHAQLAVEAVKLSRLLMGESTDNTHATITNLSELVSLARRYAAERMARESEPVLR